MIMEPISEFQFGKCTVEMYRYDDVFSSQFAPRRDYECLGKMLTWGTGMESPDENAWDTPEQWMADMLEEHFGASKVLEDLRGGRFKDLRVVEREAVEPEDAVLTIEGYGCELPYTEKSWIEGVALDAKDLEDIGAGTQKAHEVLELVADFEEDLLPYLQTRAFVLPVYTDGHLEPCFNTTGFTTSADHKPVGYIYTSTERVNETMSPGYEPLEVVAALCREVRQYSDWVQGECYCAHMSWPDGSDSWSGDLYKIDPCNIADVAKCLGFYYPDMPPVAERTMKYAKDKPKALEASAVSPAVDAKVCSASASARTGEALVKSSPEKKK